MSSSAVPSASARLPYLPALDGLRGLALIAVLLAHADVAWVRGGHIALTAFFTLSGFLITALLLVERHRTGTVDLRAFWTRRARRLVPAMLLCFPLVAVVVLLSDVPPSDRLLLDAVAAATWVANWRFVLDGQTYADLFALPSPFQHFWSLAVEEQFYLVFPLVLIAVLGVRSARPRTGRLAVLLGGLVVLSTIQAARLFEAGGGLGRAYYGTDARIAELLVGALLALALVGPKGLRVPPARVQTAVSAAGTAGLVGLLALMALLDKDAAFTYRGGFLLAACCTAAVVAAAVQPGSPVARVLAVPPLVVLGLLSYGVYLFHWPLFLLLTEGYTGLGPLPLLGVRLGTVLVLAWLSFVLLEQPVRHGGLPALPALGGWATGAIAGVVVVAAAATAVTMPTPAPTLTAQAPAGGAAGGPVGAPVPPAAGDQGVVTPQGGAAAPAPAPGAAAPAPAPAAPAPAAARPAAATVPAAFTEDPADAAVPAIPPHSPDALRVAVVGDSVGSDLGAGLRRWAEARSDVVVVSFAIPACPLSRGGERRVSADRPFPVSEACAWWGAADNERRARFEGFSPQVVLVENGLNEVFDRRFARWGAWRSPGHPQFDSFVVEEYQAAARQWGAGGAQVLLANAPCADWDRYGPFREMENGDLRVRAVNLNSYNRVAGVRQVDLFSRVCPNGQYSDDVEGVQDGRYDGFHFTAEASDALARNWLGPIVLEAGAAPAPVQPPLPGSPSG